MLVKGGPLLPQLSMRDCHYSRLQGSQVRDISRRKNYLSFGTRRYIFTTNFIHILFVASKDTGKEQQWLISLL